MVSTAAILCFRNKRVSRIVRPRHFVFLFCIVLGKGDQIRVRSLIVGDVNVNQPWLHTHFFLPRFSSRFTRRNLSIRDEKRLSRDPLNIIDKNNVRARIYILIF